VRCITTNIAVTRCFQFTERGGLNSSDPYHSST